MEAKKTLLTYTGLKKLEDELENLKVVKRKEVAGKIKEAREQGDLSENAEYDASFDMTAEDLGLKYNDKADLQELINAANKDNRIEIKR